MSELRLSQEPATESVELVSQSGLAKILGVSKQRVSQLKDAGGLPVPHGIVDDENLVWTREAAERFSAERNRALGKISLQEQSL